ncbi:hypothetical protein CYMTET_19372 [Cymbomonas tetramitiformis]|uniref:Aminotransferase class V domain-containing protein n=1 Tax=Cymbomonas tetramitiformis TaxID=36881 RepID=A0AAE0L511_9CHLO|nr:hypothetical protein CYMTET_19372 [Cymbomonas tetramitiformis]
MSFAAKCGLGEAVRYALDLGMPAIWARVQYLARELRAKLQKVGGVDVHDHGEVLCGLVSFSKRGVSPLVIKEACRKAGINNSLPQLQAEGEVGWENLGAPCTRAGFPL